MAAQRGGDMLAQKLAGLGIKAYARRGHYTAHRRDDRSSRQRAEYAASLR
jgi:hypothetical protein